MTHVAVVAGGGLAGLASAVSLAAEGWRVRVLERAAELREVGAGVALSRNAVAALRGLGLSEQEVAALGPRTWAAGTSDVAGRPILRIDPRVRDAVALRGVHRGRLHAALRAAAEAAGVEVVTSAPVTGVEPGTAAGERAVVVAAGDRHDADLVVGADGVRSAVRTALFPAVRPVYSGYSSWRAVVPDRSGGEAGLRQYWGPHAEFGLMPVGAHETYWYGYVRLPEGTAYDDELAAARARFAGWAGPVRDVLAGSDPASVLRHDVHHLPGGPPRYTAGRVVLVGDAAHATLPTVGQGAATALEDGGCVGRLVGAPVAGGRADLATALAAFDAARRPRCRALARLSVQSGRLGAHLGPRWQGVRNLALRATPQRLLSRGADAVWGWTPPGPA